jgi:hypothetical protein
MKPMLSNETGFDPVLFKSSRIELSFLGQTIYKKIWTEIQPAQLSHFSLLADLFIGNWRSEIKIEEF